MCFITELEIAQINGGKRKDLPVVLECKRLYDQYGFCVRTLFFRVERNLSL